jgi:hypothetical protein
MEMHALRVQVVAEADDQDGGRATVSEMPGAVESA